MKKNLKYLLVCEGPTDITFLKELCLKLGNDFKASIDIIELSPQKDATTSRWPPHGWTAVRSWCKSWKIKTPEEIASVPEDLAETLKRKNWKALVDMQNADGLIIQMDTDIAEKITDLNFSTHRGTRRDFCQSAIHCWMGESGETIEGAFLLLPSYAIETWLLATHNPSESIFDDLSKPINYEDLADVEQRLVTLNYPSKNKQGTRRIKKDVSRYKAYGSKVHSSFNDVTERCLEAKKFESFLKNNSEED